jgi:hypothetical protein
LYKQVCQTLQKKFSEGLQVTNPLVFTYERFLLNHSLLQIVFFMSYIFQGFGKGTDGSAVERRLKKGQIHSFLSVLQQWRQSIVTGSTYVALTQRKHLPQETVCK